MSDLSLESRLNSIRFVCNRYSDDIESEFIYDKELDRYYIKKETYLEIKTKYCGKGDLE